MKDTTPQKRPLKFQEITPKKTIIMKAQSARPRNFMSP